MRTLIDNLIPLLLFVLGMAIIFYVTANPAESYGAQIIPQGFPLSYEAGKSLTSEEKAKVASDETRVNRVIRSECFEEFFKKRPKLLRTNGKTPKEVVQHIRESEIAVTLDYYWKPFSVTHGYRVPGKLPAIRLNRKFTNSPAWKQKPCETRAALIGHETLHVLGYTHDYKATPERPFSVPYTLNAAFKACCPAVTFNEPKQSQSVTFNEPSKQP